MYDPSLDRKEEQDLGIHQTKQRAIRIYHLKNYKGIPTDLSTQGADKLLGGVKRIEFAYIQQTQVWLQHTSYICLMANRQIEIHDRKFLRP